MKYLLNLSSRTIHDATSTNGRCKIGLMHEENKMIFGTYQEAKDYLPTGRKNTAPCSFCLGSDYEKQIGMEVKK